MELSRLKELTTISHNGRIETMVEAKSAKSFDGISSIIEDALGDLSDKLGKGGSLSDLMKSSGAAKLDTVKKDGKNVMAQIAALTAEYTSAMKKLMVEADLLVSQMDEGLITEKYEDSTDFTEEMGTLSVGVDEIGKIVKSKDFMAWMKVTDKNYDTQCETAAKGVISSFGELKKSVELLNDELDKAE